MALREDSKTNFVGALAALGGVTITPATVALSTPKALTGDADGKDTQLKVTALSTSGFRGSAIYKYKRLKLSDLPGLLYQPLRVSPDDPQTLYDLFALIRKQLGINFSTDDVEDATVVTTGDGRTLKITAKAGSLVWQGSCTLTLGNLPNFSALFNSDTILWS